MNRPGVTPPVAGAAVVGAVVDPPPNHDDPSETGAAAADVVGAGTAVDRPKLNAGAAPELGAAGPKDGKLLPPIPSEG